jgi:excisionase family DNA binding protein
MGETQVPFTLSEAARAYGKGKATLHRAIRSGRLSATRAEDGATWLIDEAELMRLFGTTPIPNGTDLVGTSGTSRSPEQEARIADLQATVLDLRHRLDQSESERRGVQLRLTALLSPPERRGIWGWLRKK